MPPRLVYVILWVELRAQYMLGRYCEQSPISSLCFYNPDTETRREAFALLGYGECAICLFMVRGGCPIVSVVEGCPFVVLLEIFPCRFPSCLSENSGYGNHFRLMASLLLALANYVYTSSLSSEVPGSGFCGYLS